MADIRTIAKDPDFQKLPIEEQRKAFSEYDKDFATLPVAEQDKGIKELIGAAPESRWKTFGRKISPYVRPVLESGGAIAGGALAAPANLVAPGVSEAAGVAGGYLAGKYAADALDQYTGEMKTPTVKEGIRNIATRDIPEALEVGMTGPVIGKLGTMARLGIKNIGPTAAGARREAAQAISKATSAGAAYEQKAHIAREIEKRVPGLKFTRGQITNDPQAIMLQRALERSDTTVATFSKEQRAAANDALRKYYYGTLTEKKAGVEDFMSAVRGKRTRLETNVAQLQSDVDAKTSQLGKAMTVQETGASLTKEAREAKAAVKAQASTKFADIPGDVRVKTSPLYDAVKGVEKDFNRNLENPQNYPDRMIKGIIKEIEEAPAAPSKPVDAKGKPITQTGDRYIPPPYQATVERYSNGGGYQIKTGPTSYHQSRNGPAWYRTEDEAERFAEAMNKRNRAAFDAQNQRARAQAAEGSGTGAEEGRAKLKDLSFQGLVRLRSNVLADIRATSNPTLMRRLHQVREGIEATIDQLKADQGVAGQKYRDAAKFYREEYVQKYRQGAVNEVLRTGARGDANRLATANIAQRFFTKDGADQFVRALGDRRAARAAMKDYASYDLLNTATDPATGQLNPGKVYRWYAQHKDVLGKLGLNNEFNTVVKVNRAVDEAKATLDVFNKSIAARVLNAEPEKMVAQAFGGAGSKNTAQVAKDLLALAEGNKAAEEGLKKAFADHFYKKSLTTANDVMENPVVSVAQMTRTLRENAPAIREMYKGEPKKIKALMDVRKAYEILDRTAKSPLGGGSDTAENLLTVLGRITEPAMGHSRIINTARTAWKFFKGMKTQDANKLIIRAAFDPDYAESLMFAAKGGPAKKAIEATTKRAIGMKPMPRLTGTAIGYGAANVWNALIQEDRK